MNILNTFAIFLMSFGCIVGRNISNSISANYDIIKLNSTNFLLIKDEITSKTASDFIYELNKSYNKDLYVYLDTPGGSVEDGNKIISEVKKYNLKCIVDRAYSMGFAILQACKERLILPHGKLMQHQISYGLRNENSKVLSYIKFINQMEREMVEFQANRIKMHPETFRQKTMNEWWTFGKNAVRQNIVDKIVDVKCDSKVTNQNFTREDRFFKHTYSKCPLISDPIASEKVKNSDNLPFFV